MEHFYSIKRNQAIYKIAGLRTLIAHLIMHNTRFHKKAGQIMSLDSHGQLRSLILVREQKQAIQSSLKPLLVEYLDQSKLLTGLEIPDYPTNTIPSNISIGCDVLFRLLVSTYVRTLLKSHYSLILVTL